MKYQYIVNPVTNKKCKLLGKKGTQIFNQYIKQIGGNKVTIIIYPELHKEISSNNIDDFINIMTHNSGNIIKNTNLNSELIGRINNYIHNNTNLSSRISDNNSIIIEVDDFPVKLDDKIDYIQNYILNYSFDHTDFRIDNQIYTLSAKKVLVDGKVFKLRS